MAARTDRQVEQSIAASAAALGLPASALAPTQLPWEVGTTPVPAGTFTMLDPANATGKQTILGSTVPAYGAGLAGPVAVGAAPLSNPTYVAKPKNTTTNVYDASGNVIGTNTVTYNWDGTPNAPVYTAGASASTSATSATQDAFALLEQTFNSYGLESLAPLIKGYMQQNMGPYQAALLLKQTPEYQARFAGNFARKAAGLNMLSEAEYLALENSYTNLFGAYGVKNLANKNQFATLIGNDVSSTELTSRLDLAVNQVQNADPTVVATLKQFYPSVSNQDLVSYFLAPGETLPKLQMQVQAADIGAAATQQGLPTSKASAEALAKYGVTYGQAQTGYGKIAEALPTTQKLSQIYGAQTGINYDQTEAEAQYLKNSGAAALEQQKLKELETAQFQGRSGVLGANASGYSGSLGKNIQGSY